MNEIIIKKGQLDLYTIFIASRHFETIDDFINLEFAVKRFVGNMTKFFYNPISIQEENIDFFPKAETLHLYTKEDQFIIDDVVISKVMCIGPVESADILYKLLNAVTIPNKSPSDIVKKDIPLLNTPIPKKTIQTA